MRSRRSRLLLLGALLTFSAEAALAELRVMRSSVPARYPVGTRLPDDHRFHLGEGARVNVNHSGGGRYTITGPADGPLSLLIEQRRAQRNTARAGN